MHWLKRRNRKTLIGFVTLTAFALIAGCGGDENGGDENPCSPNPCTAAHKTTCLQSSGQAVCVCDTGYYDDNGTCKEITGDECDPNPCTEAHKTQCAMVGGQPTCFCDDGYVELNGTCVEYSDKPYTCDQNNLCVLTGTITQSITLTPDKDWLLRGGVFIGDDEHETILTIEPGTTVYGESSTAGMLVITRGSKIMAQGTKDSPIVFTSSKNPGSRARGDWGGLIINGRATINACAEDSKTEGQCEAFGEGGTGWYGGNDDADSSGTLRYVRVEFAGRIISPDNELNGIALQGVGSGTTLEYLQVHMNKDDGIEFFGGTANFKYVLTTGIADDNLDWTDGWRGKGQFFVAQQYDDAGDNGIEADNNAEDNTTLPRSHPVLSNLTLIGVPTSEKSDLGMLLREGTAANIHNALVVGWNEAGLDIDHAETWANAQNGAGGLSGQLTIAMSTIHNCTTPFLDDSDNAIALSDFFSTLNAGNTLADPQLIDPFNVSAPNYKPGAGSPAITGAQVPTDSFFTQVNFKGGVDPNDDWTAGWTIHDLN